MSELAGSTARSRSIRPILVRPLALLGVLLAAGPLASAQTREFGVKAGPSFAMLAFQPDDSGEYDRRISADGGGFGVLPLARPIAIQIEALFTSRGAELYDREVDLTGTILLQYFEIPALVRLQGPHIGSQSLHFFAGPYAGVRISAKRQVSTVVGSIKTGEQRDMTGEVERFDIGLAVGAGIDIGSRVVVDGRYTRGLTALNTDRSDGFRIRNRGISIMAGVRF